MYVYVCITLHKIQIIIILSCFNNYIKSAPQFHSTRKKPKTFVDVHLASTTRVGPLFFLQNCRNSSNYNQIFHIDLIASQICMM